MISIFLSLPVVGKLILKKYWLGSICKSDDEREGVFVYVKLLQYLLITQSCVVGCVHVRGRYSTAVRLVPSRMREISNLECGMDSPRSSKHIGLRCGETGERQGSLPTLPHCWLHYVVDVVDVSGVVVVQRHRPTPGTPSGFTPDGFSRPR